MTDYIYLCGASGGAGVTTCAFRIGLALARKGERTLVVDGDSDCASGLSIAQIPDFNFYTLADARSGACRVKQAVIPHPLSPNLYFLPTLECYDAKFIEECIKHCGQLFDRVICDNTAIGVCGRAVVVCDPYRTSLERTKKTASLLKDGGLKNTGLIVNKVNGGLVFDGAILTPQEFSSVTRCSLWGVIPEDLTLPLGRAKKQTVKAFSMTADFIIGNSQKTFGVLKPYLGLKGMIKRKMRDWI
ncbi:MAG: hypothetical protein ACI4MS_07110 [Candidatus Coproplasma sp.]